MSVILTACTDSPWNRPYDEAIVKDDTLFTSFDSPPKHLDPVVSYNSNEWAITSQVYEPMLQYHYLKQPYTLEPLTLRSMPSIRYLDNHNQDVAASSDSIAFTEYRFQLASNILFQPHPAFVKKGQGQYLYHHLQSSDLVGIHSPSDFKQQDTRVLKAQDYVYAIQRMALAQNHSPIFHTMKNYIVGLGKFANHVNKRTEKDSQFPYSSEFRRTHISGVHIVSDTEFTIKIHGKYPQFIYWLSMNFFAPIPWEAEVFYHQQPLIDKNITLDTYPVGTGAYQLTENNPNQRMILQANPNYRHPLYPSDGLAKGASAELLKDAGKPLPFIKKVVYSLEKESVPLWNKFLQGYYDASGVSSDSFDQAISMNAGGQMSLTSEMEAKGIRFLSTVEPTIYYFAFNMADPVVGGYGEKQRKLRQAISIAINMEEYISIFLNGRGVAAQGPIPPGLFGSEVGKSGMNPYVYNWVDGRAQRKSIETARKLMKEAGYPGGRNAQGERLKLFYDTAATGPGSKASLNWYRKQFAKLGIQLVIRATDYNRFQDKVRSAKVQTFSWGWNADYPDPENFLFLLAGMNASINTNGTGINSANYDQRQYDQWFRQMKTMTNGPQRAALIHKMVRKLQQDAPWVWGFHPQSLALYHGWYRNVWANPLANNTLKYKRILPNERFEKQRLWNQPVLWPLVVFVLGVLVILAGLVWHYRARQSERIDVKRDV